MIKKRIVSILTCAFLLFASAPAAFAEEVGIDASEGTTIEQPADTENIESGDTEEDKEDIEKPDPEPEEPGENPGEEPEPSNPLEKPIVNVSVESSCLVIKWDRIEGALKYIVYK